MHKKFDSAAIEKKWQDKWEASKLYDVGTRDVSKEKEYVLVEWPYPSGNLHIGHWYAFGVPDIYVRFKRMTGKQVLYPMGFDAFGLPAENAAIKRNLNPKDWTNENIAYMRSQLRSMGNAFSWDTTCNSTDPEYYKWTQWMFTEFFKHNIAYRGKGIVNWCPGCNTVIANEQVLADGTCERSGDIIEKKAMPQWMLRITQYADRLIDDLAELNWPEHIKEAQRQWIGRSKGAEVDFKLSTGEVVTVFTTRPDTLYGATYVVLAPEHPLVAKNEVQIENYNEVALYVTETKKKNEQDRLDASKEKTGVKLEGITATNPASGEEIPVYIADYVLGGYGTGAIMAVPAHDERDNAFTQKFNLPIVEVVSPIVNQLTDITFKRTGVYGLIYSEEKGYLLQFFRARNYYWLPGGGIESGESEIECLTRELREETGYIDIEITSKIGEPFYDYVAKDGNTGRNKSVVYSVKLNSETREEITLTEGEKNDGLELVWVKFNELHETLDNGEVSRSNFLQYIFDKQPDTIFTDVGALVNSGEFDGLDSEVAKAEIVEKVGGRMTSTYRLRDWSIGRQRYWGVPIPIVYDPAGKAHVVPKEHLPWLLPEDVDFRPTGEAPLQKSQTLKQRTEEIFGTGWTPEVETMDTFVDSSWYFLRYLDTHNTESLSSLQTQKDWMPVDTYFGGAEHTTMHLLYSRFWQKALYDLNLVTDKEPYKRRINRGLILGPDGNKMSKSKGNVIDPDEQVRLVGADSVKMYLAFLGPYEGSNYPFDLSGIAGVRRFLERVYGLREHILETESEAVTRLLHKTITKVRTDIEEFKFNTAISSLMIFLNQAEKAGLSGHSHETFIRLLAPFAPYLSEEIWLEIGHVESIHLETYPLADPKLLIATEVTMGVQINGKMRGTIVVSPTASEAEALQAALATPDISRYATADTIEKIIYVPGRILNLVVRVE